MEASMSVARWTALAGIVFAVCFVVGMMLTGDAPSGDDPDQKIIDYYGDSGHQTTFLIIAYLEVVAAISLVSFATLAFRDAGASPLAAVARASGYLVAAAIALGTIALASVGAGAAIDNSPVDPGSARFLQSVGYGTILLVGGLSATAMIATGSVHWMRTGLAPAWVVWFGLLCAVACIFSIVFIPMLALPLWAIVIGVRALMRPMAVDTRMAPNPSMS
jgi:hypothetical protein